MGSTSGRALGWREQNGTVIVSADPVRCRLRFRDLTSADAHALQLTLTFTAQALDEPAERQMFSEAFLDDRNVVTSDDVATHFNDPLAKSIARLIESQPAEHWMSDDGRGTIVEALRKAAEPIAFASGIELIPPFDVAVESATLTREKIETMQRKLLERRTEGQAQHVARAAELMKQFQSLRDTTPGTSAGKILEQVSPADRGSMLETLLMASASGGELQSLWAVAGPNLVKIDARTSPAKCEIVAVPTELGPLRSVQSGTIDGVTKLLVGAQAGVIVVDPTSAHLATCYADRGVASSLGFNSVLSNGNGIIWATHGDAGLVAWEVGKTDEPWNTIRKPGARNLAMWSETGVLFSAGNDVLSADSAKMHGALIQGSPGGTSGPAQIAVIDGRVIVVRANGAVDEYDFVTLAPIGSHRHCGEVTAAALLPWMGSTRLLMATADGPVCCVGLDDELVTQYTSVHRGLRTLAATNDLIAGVSPDRQRIVTWKSWDGRQPAGEIHIGNIARHRAADVCFA